MVLSRSSVSAFLALLVSVIAAHPEGDRDRSRLIIVNGSGTLLAENLGTRDMSAAVFTTGFSETRFGALTLELTQLTDAQTAVLSVAKQLHSPSASTIVLPVISDIFSAAPQVSAGVGANATMIQPIGMTSDHTLENTFNLQPIPEPSTWFAAAGAACAIALGHFIRRGFQQCRSSPRAARVTLG